MNYVVGQEIELAFLPRSTSNIHHVIDIIDVTVSSVENFILAESSFGTFQRIERKGMWEWRLFDGDPGFSDDFTFADLFELQRESNESATLPSSAMRMHVSYDIPAPHNLTAYVLRFDPTLIPVFKIAA